MNRRPSIIPKNNEGNVFHKRDDNRAHIGNINNDVTASPSSNIAEKNLISRHRYTLFFIAASFPLSFGNIGPVADVLWIEWLAPVIFVVMLFKIFNTSRLPVPIGGRFSATAIIILAMCALGHFIFHPVSSQTLLGAASASGGLRAYFRLLVCICVFFIAYWSAAYWQKQATNWAEILRVIMWISLSIGLARLTTFLLGIELPFLKGVFVYDEGAAVLERAYRIGGLTECGTLGLAALLALNLDRQWRAITYVFLYIFLFLMVMGGGRSSMAGVLAALFVYFVLLRREISKAVVFALLLMVIVLALSNIDLFTRQFGRIDNVGGDFEELQPKRAMVYNEMWQIFLNHPFFGKGVGTQFINTNLPDFVVQQTSGGGHGAYFSAIGLFGIPGILHLVANLFRPIWIGLRRLLSHRKARLINPDIRMAAAFVVLALIILAFESTVAGNGYASFRMYLYAGIMGGVLARVNYER